MALVPIPSGADDLFDSRVLWFPTQCLDGLFGTGDQSWRVASASGFVLKGYFDSSHFFAGGDNLADRKSLAVAEVEVSTNAGREGLDVGLSQVGDVNIVANAGAVGSRVITAQNIDVGPFSEGHLEDQRNQVGFNPVVLPEFVTCSGSVEVPERDELQPVQLMVPAKDLFKHQFGFAVRVDGPLRETLIHWNLVRWSVRGAGGTKDEFPNPGGHGRIRQVDGVAYIVPKILGRIGHGFADQGVRGEMNDGLGLGTFDRLRDPVAVLQIQVDKPRPWIDSRAMSLAEIVQDSDLMSGIAQFGDAHRTDVARSSGDKNVHASR